MVSWSALRRAAAAEFGCDLPAGRIAAIVAEHARDLTDRGGDPTHADALRQLRLLMHLALGDVG